MARVFLGTAAGPAAARGLRRRRHLVADRHKTEWPRLYVIGIEDHERTEGEKDDRSRWHGPDGPEPPDRAAVSTGRGLGGGGRRTRRRPAGRHGAVVEQPR